MTPDAPLPETLTTERLTLRPITLDDLPFLVALHQDREVVRYLGGDGGPRPPEKTRAFVDDVRRWYTDHGVGQYLAVERATGEPVGRSGLSLFRIERTPSRADGVPIARFGPGEPDATDQDETVLEVGYTFARRAWGRGFATEAARPWYAHVVGVRRRDAYSVIHPDNAGSIRVAEKNGLRFEGRIVFLEGRAYRLYRLPLAVGARDSSSRAS